MKHRYRIKLLVFILLCGFPAYGRMVIPDYGCFTEGLIDDIHPKGWLYECLQRQSDGLTGHPEALAYPYNTCLWAGEIERKNENPVAKDWWRYEQTAYYTDGLLRLGYLLDDKTFIEKGESGIDYTIEHAADNGRLGNRKIESQWPMAVFFRAMLADYWATGNEAIPLALERHYLSLTPELLAVGRRHIVNLEGLLWTYGKTKNACLLQLAESAYALGGFELDAETAANDSVIYMHGVTYAEMLKIPLLLYAYTGKQHYYELAMNAERKLERDHLLPDGLYTSAEFTRGDDIDIPHETCDISDYTWSLGYFLQVTGNCEWADRLERAVFNAGFGSIAKDFRALQYFSYHNQFISTGSSDNSEYRRGSMWMAYRPVHETECCVGNVNRFLPNFASRLWMRGRNQAVVATLYAPNETTFDIDGEKVTIIEDTNYPFEEEVRFRISTKSEVDFPLVIRIPGWCNDALLFVNGQQQEQILKPGTFVSITRSFNDGDVITLKLPMQAVLKDYRGQGVFVERGPLLFSYAISQEKVEDTTVYECMNGKHSENPDFKCWNILPKGPFNYAVEQETIDNYPLTVVEKQGNIGYPFDLDNAPIRISIPVREIDWKITGGLNPFMPSTDSIVSYNKTNTIELVPYGCTELRLTVFPVVKGRAHQVNTLIGAQRGKPSGHVFPGAVYPHGMIQFTPTYFDRDAGIVVNQASGAGCPHMGNFPTLVLTGNMKSSPNTMRDTPFHIKEEYGYAGYYEAKVNQNILLELTATERTGMARYVFPDTIDSGTVLIGAGVSASNIEDAKLTIVAPNCIEGYADGGYFCGMKTPYRVYMVAMFDTEAAETGVWKEDSLSRNANVASGSSSGVYFTFDTRGKKTIHYKVGISYVSIENARENLLTENSGWDFRLIQHRAEKAWEELLGKIDVVGGTQKHTTMFYTHLYHAFIHPSLFNDVNGEYIGADNKIHKTRRRQFSMLSNWDTYRTQIQLLSILEPDVAGDIVNSLQDFAMQSGGSFPRWVLANIETGIMQGDPSSILVANAWAYGARDYDAHLLMGIMRRGAEIPGAKSQQRETRPHLKQYLEKGFCPASIHLEYASADYAIGQFALHAVGDNELAERYFKRAKSWQNLYNPQTQWLQSRYENGEWKPLSEDFREATYQDYFWMVPFDLDTLIQLIGGKEVAEQRLDNYFTRLDAGFHDWWFAAGNEPSFATPWVYNRLGRPDKTSALVKRILDEQYSDTSTGMPGDDDLGAMGAWYVWANVGLYPMIPGVGGFTVNTPRFPSITIHLPHSDISIEVGSENRDKSPAIYINGHLHPDTWIDWHLLSHGAAIKFYN